MPVDLDELTKPFPPQAIKQRKGGGGRMYDYVEGETVIRRLNAATGNNWSFRVVRLDVSPVGDSILYSCIGELEIPGHGARQGIGVQLVASNGGEDLAKGAATDALKKAATLFGVALELYGPDIEAGEVAAAVVRQQRQPDVRPHEPAAPAQAANADRDPSLASNDQIRAIFGAGKRVRGYNPDTVKEWVGEQYGKHVDHLTKAEASDAINRLQTPV